MTRHEDASQVDGRGAWAPVFRGRSTELMRLRSAFASIVDDPKPRVVVLSADSGWGKTRLAQEFYAALASEAGRGYWPPRISEGRSLSVNPSFSEHRIPDGTELPFLWWGLRCPDAGEDAPSRCSVLSSYLPHLAPHLQPMFNAAANKAVLLKGGKIVLNLASLGFSELMADAKTLLETGFLIAARAGGKSDGSIDDLQQQQHGAIEETVFQHFRQLMTWRRGEARIPLVIFLDDAQFIDADESLQRLLSRLLDLAHANAYPLLVVAGHWAADWRFQRAHEGMSRHLRPGLVSMLRRAQDSWGDVWSSDEHARGSGVLLELGPLDEADELLRDATPDLSVEDRALVLARAGGNPLVIEQLYRRFLRRQIDGGRVTVTAEMREAIRNAPLALHSLIEERLTQPDVEEAAWALALAVRSGPRIHARLLLEALSGGDRERAVRGLSIAEDVECLIERTAGELLEFVQPAVREVVTGISQRIMPPDDFDARTASAIMRLLDVDSPTEHFGEAMVIGEGADRFLDPSDPDAIEPLVGSLGARAVAAKHSGDDAGALELALRFQAILSRSDAGSSPDRHGYSPSIAQLLFESGRAEAAWEVLEASRESVSSQPDRRLPANTELAYARFLDTEIEVLRTRNELETAESKCHELLAFLEARREHRDYWRATIRALTLLARTAIDRGAGEEAIGPLERARELARPGALASDDQFTIQRAMIIAADLADAYRGIGKPVKAAEALAHAFAQDASMDLPPDPATDRLRLLAYARAIQVSTRLKHPEARSFVTGATSLAHHLVNYRPTPAALSDLSDIHFVSAKYFIDQEDRDSFESRVREFSQAVCEYAANTDPLRALVLAEKILSLLSSLPEGWEAGVIWAAFFDICVASLPGFERVSVERRFEFALRVGVLLQLHHHQPSEVARDSHDRYATGLLEASRAEVMRAPSAASIQLLGCATEAFVLVHDDTDRRDEAVAAARSTLVILQGFVAVDPISSLDWRQSLGWSLSMSLARHGDPDGARAALGEVISALHEAMRVDGGNPHWHGIYLRAIGAQLWMRESAPATAMEEALGLLDGVLQDYQGPLSRLESDAAELAADELTQACLGVARRGGEGTGPADWEALQSALSRLRVATNVAAVSKSVFQVALHRCDECMEAGDEHGAARALESADAAAEDAKPSMAIKDWSELLRQIRERRFALEGIGPGRGDGAP